MKELLALYDLIPLSTKNIPYKGWMIDDPLTVESLKTHLKTVGPHIGIRLRSTDLVVDVDAKGKHHQKDGLNSALKLPALDEYPTVLTPSGGRHHLMTKPADLEIETHLPDYPGIDFLTKGQYIVAAGSTYKVPGLSPYQWDLSSPELPCQMAPDELLAMLVVKKAASLDSEPEWSGEELAAYLEKLDPVEIAGSNDAWLQIAAACHEATGGQGEQEFLEWSARDPLYADKTEINRTRWRSFKTGKSGNAGAGTLRKIALDAGITDLTNQGAEDDFKDIEDEDVSPDVEKKETPIQRLNRMFGVVAEGGKVYVVDLDPGLHERAWYASDQFFKLCTSVLKMGSTEIKFTINGKDSIKKISMGHYWFEMHKKKQTFIGATLEPLQGRRTTNGSLNLWRGFAFTPREGKWDLMKAHIHEIICSGDDGSSEYILDWLARAIQQPDKPGEVALVMQGGMGVGKGVLGSALARLFGHHGAEIRSREHLTGRFNHHLRDKCVLFADEAVWSGNKEAESVLKGMITEKRLAYERKGADIVWDYNRLKIIMASNEKWVAPVAWDDRRYAVFKTAPVKRGRAYFNALFKELDNGGYEAMLHELSTRDISLFHVLDDRPNTVGLKEQKKHSMQIEERWFFDMIETDDIHDLVVDQGGQACILKSSLLSSFASYLSREGARNNGFQGMSEQIGYLIPKFFPSATTTKCPNADGRRENAYRIVDFEAVIAKIKESL